MNAKLKEKLEDFEEVEIGNDAAIYPTGVVCKIIGIPIWALKQLDIEGLVCPPREKVLSDVINVLTGYTLTV